MADFSGTIKQSFVFPKERDELGAMCAEQIDADVC